MINNTLREQAIQLNNDVYSISAELENLGHIESMLYRIAEDAADKKGTDLEKHFLWDNNAPLQVANDYLYHVLKVVTETQKEVERVANEMFDVIVKGKEKENTPNGCNQ